eukprot:688985-Pleurochrysis_carterae.AAC.1
MDWAWACAREPGRTCARTCARAQRVNGLSSACAPCLFLREGARARVPALRGERACAVRACARTCARASLCVRMRALAHARTRLPVRA